MSYEVRPLGPEDQRLAWELAGLTFGYHDRPMPEGWSSDSRGRRTLGVFDAEGRMVGKAVDREQGHWFGGRVVPAAGIAGVATAAERRGSGVARAVLTRLLADWRRGRPVRARRSRRPLRGGERCRGPVHSEADGSRRLPGCPARPT